MVGSVAVLLAVLTRFAGAWGVPYFSFTSDRGSGCVNTWTGFSCDRLSLAEVEWRADVDLPASTQVLSGRYVSTHDYTIDATLRTPKADAAAALEALQGSFGKCLDDRPAPTGAGGLKSLCVLADDLSDADSDDPGKSSRLYTVGTGLDRNGDRVTVLSVRSR